MDLIQMAVTVKIPTDLARRLNTLVDENLYPTQEAALEDAIRFLVAMKGKLYNRSEIQEILSRYISVPTDKILQDVRQEEEL
jgi:metal-responsive CopG/Arc/MetJ family transcriptional regulator